MNFKDGYGNTLSIRNLERSKQLNKSMLVQFSIYRIKLSMQLYVTGAAINRLDIARGKKSRSDDVLPRCSPCFRSTEKPIYNIRCEKHNRSFNRRLLPRLFNAFPSLDEVTVYNDFVRFYVRILTGRDDRLSRDINRRLFFARLRIPTVEFKTRNGIFRFVSFSLRHVYDTLAPFQTLLSSTRCLVS